MLADNVAIVNMQHTHTYSRTHTCEFKQEPECLRLFKFLRISQFDSLMSKQRTFWIFDEWQQPSHGDDLELVCKKNKRTTFVQSSKLHNDIFDPKRHEAIIGMHTCLCLFVLASFHKIGKYLL